MCRHPVVFCGTNQWTFREVWRENCKWANFTVSVCVCVHGYLCPSVGGVRICGVRICMLMFMLCVWVSESQVWPDTCNIFTTYTQDCWHNISSFLYTSCIEAFSILCVFLLSFYRTNHVRQFVLKRPFFKGKKDKENEFKVRKNILRWSHSWLSHPLPRRHCMLSVQYSQLPFPSLENWDGLKLSKLKW